MQMYLCMNINNTFDLFHNTDFYLEFFKYSLKIYGLIQSFQAGVFSTQFLLKIPVFELDNRFVFHRT